MKEVFIYCDNKPRSINRAASSINSPLFEILQKILNVIQNDSNEGKLFYLVLAINSNLSEVKFNLFETASSELSLMFTNLFSSILMIISYSNQTSIEWDISWINSFTPDNNLPTRRAIGVNNAYPINPIHLNLGDYLTITIHNSLQMGTSLHFHGLFQKGSNNMDGAPGFTQCLIQPGASFTYNFQPQQSGTYWVHAHNNGQYVGILKLTIKTGSELH